MQQLKSVSSNESATATAAGEAGNVRVPAVLLGTWVNTNEGSRGLVQVILSLRNGVLMARIFGAGETSPHDWGEVKAAVYAKDARSHEAEGVGIFYDFGFMETHLQAHEKQGVLVVAKFDRFKDGSGRSNRYSREFFYRLEA